jgi:hypothetical protein
MPDAYQKKPPLPPPPLGGYDKAHQYRPGLRCRKVKLEMEKKRLLNVLHREVEKLLIMSASSKSPLSKDDRESAIAYLKQVREVQKAEKEEEEGMTEEQLAKIAEES